MEYEKLPIRCFECRFVTGNKWETYQLYLEKFKSPQLALDKMNIMRPCCRNLIMSSISYKFDLDFRKET